jgi:colanic acid biosynthesis glycosyl transferase WcaI
MTLGFTAGLFKLFRRAPVLLDVVDLWPDAISGSGMVSSNVLIKGAEWIAQYAYSVADKITVPTDGFAKRLISAGVLKEKIHVLPHWADRTLFDAASRNLEFGELHQLQGKFCIIHGGNIGPYQDIENILLAAERVRDLESLRIVFVGGGRDLEKMKRLKDEHNLRNVIFTGSYPAEAMPGIFAWADALLVSLRSGPYLDINLPSKLPSYMAAGRPIIASAGGETSRIVKENNLGFICQPGAPDLLAETLRDCLNTSLAQRNSMGFSARRHFEMHFDKEVLISDYANMLEKMAKCDK